jgi:hypothetical protein
MGAVCLTEHVELVHSIDVRAQRFWLDAAVLLRGSLPGWQISRTPPEPRSPRPLLAPGGGAHVGPNSFFVDRRDRVLWINRSFRLPLNECNLVILDHADEPIEVPVVHAILTINSDLGAAPSEAFLIAHAMRDAVQRLIQSLEESVHVQAFLHS